MVQTWAFPGTIHDALSAQTSREPLANHATQLQHHHRRVADHVSRIGSWFDQHQRERSGDGPTIFARCSVLGRVQAGGGLVEHYSRRGRLRCIERVRAPLLAIRETTAEATGQGADPDLLQGPTASRPLRSVASITGRSGPTPAEPGGHAAADWLEQEFSMTVISAGSEGPETPARSPLGAHGRSSEADGRPSISRWPGAGTTLRVMASSSRPSSQNLFGPATPSTESAPGDGEGDVVDGGHRPEAHRQAVGLEHHVAHGADSMTLGRRAMSGVP